MAKRLHPLLAALTLSAWSLSAAAQVPPPWAPATDLDKPPPPHVAPQWGSPAVHPTPPPPYGSPNVVPTPGVNGHARDALAAQYQALQAHDAARFTSTFATDAFVFGPRASDAYAGNAAAFASGFAQRGAQMIQSRGLEFRQAGDVCAWSFDEVEITSAGRPLRYHVTSLLDGSSGQWQVAAQSWSIPVRPTYALAMSNRNAWIDLAPIHASVGPGAEQPQRVVQQWLTTKTFEPIQGRHDTLLINAWPDDNRRGDAEIVDALDSIRTDSNFIVAPNGGTHARTVCGGRMAYVAFNQNVSIGTTNGPTVALKTRGLTFFEREGNRFRPVLLEVSLGHPNYP